MSNGDYNPSFQPQHFSNDHKQTVITMVGLTLASLVSVGLILATIFATHACSG